MPIDLSQARSVAAAWTEAYPKARARKGIQRCDELRRIVALPERDPFAGVDALIDSLTEALKTPSGTMRLLPAQAAALADIAQENGAMVPLGLGEGKTLVSLLAPVVLGSERPLLLLPAKLVSKTRREMLEYAKHFRVAMHLRIESYERVSRSGTTDFLEQYNADLLIADEAHKLRNPRSGVTRKVRKFIEKALPKCVFLSATFVRKKLADWAHLADWALHERSPAPRKLGTVIAWGTALDEGASGDPGALYEFGDPPAAAYAVKVSRTPGIVSTVNADIGTALYLSEYVTEYSGKLAGALRDLEYDYTLPTGEVLTDPKNVARAMRQLELGFYYRWVTPAPEAWAEKRLAWSQFVRHTLRYVHTYDTELEIRQAALRGSLGRDGRAVCEDWYSTKDTFKPDTECVWVDTSPIERIAAAGREAPMLIAIHHSEAGRQFERLGIPYYGQGGYSESGRFVEDEQGDRSIAISIESNKEGRNLQQFSRILIAELPRDNVTVEQLIGRVHRTGQQQDECLILFHLSTEAARAALARLKAQALYQAEIERKPKKLLKGTWL